MTIYGLDLSLNCPALCKLAEDRSFQNSEIFYLTNTKKYVGVFQNITGSLHKMYNPNDSMQRYQNIVNWLFSHNSFDNDQDTLYIEGYSMGSTGSRVFDIGECGGIVKYNLWKEGIRFIPIPPTTVKKYVGKGNFSKEEMYAAFVKKTDFDIFELLGCEGNKVISPISDIVDAYFIAQCGKDMFP